MGLFDKFRETIFLKKDSDLEKKIDVLNKYKDKVLEQNKINNDIKIAEIGLKGEKDIEFELKNANIGMYVLHDVVIMQNDLTTQIDYVIVTPAYTYLVECKNLLGNIFINEQGEFRREYSINGMLIKEAIYSPYRQALRHLEVLKKKWLEKNNKLYTFLFEKSFENAYKPLVVLANSKGMLNMQRAPKEIKNSTIRVDQLVEYIKKDITSYDKDLLSNQKAMKSIAENFFNNHVNREIDYLKDYTLKDNNVNDKREKLADKLKEFRSARSKEKKIPPYFIFNNEELERLINYLPKSIEELRDKNILESIKIKCHGEEIIKIIKMIIDE